MSRFNRSTAAKGRERSVSIRRSAPAESESQPDKRRNTEKTVIVGSCLGKTKNMRSPQADIFVYGLNKSTTKNEIVADLIEGDICSASVE